MSKSATGTGGRGPDTGEIVDAVICHGKRKYWARRSSYHYRIYFIQFVFGLEFEVK